MKSIIDKIKLENPQLGEIDVNEIINHHKSIPPMNKSMTEITNTIYDVLKKSGIPNIETSAKKLIGYQFIDEIYLLKCGKYIRWISNNKLMNGGIIVDIKFLDNGTHILCKNNLGRFIQLQFNSSILYFQKLTTTEQLLLFIN